MPKPDLRLSPEVGDRLCGALSRCPVVVGLKVLHPADEVLGRQTQRLPSPIERGLREEEVGLHLAC